MFVRLLSAVKQSFEHLDTTLFSRSRHVAALFKTDENLTESFNVSYIYSM